MATQKKVTLLHKRSNVVQDGKAKLPVANDMEYGEIAINYAKDAETISIKNSDNEIVSLPVGDVATNTDINSKISPIGGDTVESLIEKIPYDFVDLGLPSGLLWATCNIGANKPEDYGLYFAWGETEGFEDATAKGDFSWATAPYRVSGTDTGIKWSKYTSTNSSSSTGVADNKLVLEPEDDAAHVIMGGDWRMPTIDDFSELRVNTTSQWVTNYNGTDINGVLFTSKTDITKKLFFPAAGYANNTTTGIIGADGRYWTSSLDASYNYDGQALSIGTYGVANIVLGRWYGASIRPVLEKS